MELIYRKLDANGDYTFGQGSGNFYKNEPEAVAQAVKTRLGLIQGEWFLDIETGTPYNSQILGAGTISLYDSAIQEVILNTVGVTKIVNYSSQVNASTRNATVNCTIDTIFGTTSIEQTI